MLHSRKSPDPDLLLSWYDIHARELPWRSKPGEPADPYRVWISEIMLQQTTVAAVIPYFEAFIARWPSVAELAAAPDEEVLQAWAGLGYYARARNLIACARYVSGDLGGDFPTTEAGLLALPGIGPYTAAAIAAIAYGHHTIVVDGNVERVMARLFAVKSPLPAAKPALRLHAATLTPTARAGEYAQAVMDLGATICRPKSPLCGACPWVRACLAHADGIAATLPARAPKKPRPVRYGTAFWATRGDGQVLLRQRPEKGLLGAMMEIPSTPWRGVSWDGDDALAHAPVFADWNKSAANVRHIFTHFELRMAVWCGSCGPHPDLRDVARPERCRWAAQNSLDGEALPSVMRKIAAAAITANDGTAD